MAKNQLFKLLYGMYHVGVPCMVWSNPGLGKTSTIKYLGEILNVPVEIRSGNKSDPTDFTGIPHLVDGTDGEKVVKYSVPSYAKTLIKNPNGILFLDELTTCQSVIQSAMLSIVQDGSFGEFSIPDSIFRVAAGNYNNIVGTNKMSMALMNRFTHIFYEVSADSFIEGFLSSWNNYELPTIAPKGTWIDRELNYRIMVTNYLRDYPEDINTFKEDIVNETDVAYATPRSWDMAVKILTVLGDNDEEYVKELLSGTIGRSIAERFITSMDKGIKLGYDFPSILARKELDTVRLMKPNDLNYVSMFMGAVQYYFDTDPLKYSELLVHTYNLLYNKDNKYGKYPPYNALIMRYLKNNISKVGGLIKIGKFDFNKFTSSIDGYSELSAAV